MSRDKWSPPDREEFDRLQERLSKKYKRSVVLMDFHNPEVALVHLAVSIQQESRFARYISRRNPILTEAQEAASKVLEFMDMPGYTVVWYSEEQIFDELCTGIERELKIWRVS